MTTTALIQKLAGALEMVSRQIGSKFEPTAGYVERTIDLHGDECQAIKEALTETRAWLATGGWMTTDSAPKDGTKIMMRDEDEEITAVCFWKERSQCWAVSWDEEEFTPDIWQPLPPTRRRGSYGS